MEIVIESQNHRINLILLVPIDVNFIHICVLHIDIVYTIYLTYTEGYLNYSVEKIF